MIFWFAIIFQMMYKNVTFTPKGQYTPIRQEKDWTSISFSSVLIDDLSQFQIEPPSDAAPESDGGPFDEWWEAAAGTKKDFDDLIYRLKGYQ